MKQRKRVVWSVLLVCVMVFCFGCGKEESVICKVGDQTFNEKDMLAYGIMFAHEHGLYSGDDFEAVYEDGMTYEEYYKKQLKEDVVNTLLMYCKAMKEDVKLDKEEKKQVKEHVEEIIDAYGSHWLNNNKLNKDIIERVCTIRSVSNKYLKQEMEDAGVETEDAENDRYVKIHQIQFMTVQMKQNGMIDTSLDGSAQELSATQMLKVKREAEDFASRAQAEQSITIKRNEYDSYMSDIENYYKYDDLEDGMRQAIDTMEQGDISEVVRFQYGYSVFELKEADATDFSKTLYEYEYAEQERLFKENWLKELKIEVTKESDIVVDDVYWNQAKMSDYIH